MNFFLVAISVLVGGYFFVIFFLSRLLVPFMGFKQYSPPRELSEEILKEINILVQDSHDQRSFLDAVYAFVQERWRSEHLKTFLKLKLIFRTDIGEIWHSRGYAHCTTINFILYTMLVNSPYFKEEDIQIRHAFFNMVAHQYLRVRVDGQWLDVDPSTVYTHEPVGKRARWFG